MSSSATTETPAAGNNNQPLFYDSALDKYVHKTAAQARALLSATPARVYKSGQWYSYDCPVTGYGVNGFALNQANAVPIYVATSTTFDRISLEVTTGQASCAIRLGIYNDTGSFYPGTVALDAGTIDASTTGQKTITISQALAAGQYWLALACQGAAGTVLVRATGMSLDTLPISNPANTAVSGSFTMTGVSGALPTWSASLTMDQSTPRIMLRAA